MGEEEPLQPDEGANERNLAAELAALSARVAALERQLGAMHGAPAAPQPWDSVAAVPVEPLQANPAVAEGLKPASPPPPPMPSFIPAGRHPQPRPSLESRLGAQVFNRIGIFVLLIGSALGLKLAVDNQLIGPVGRIVIGLIAGAGLIVWSERFRKKHFVAFSYSLKAIGTGVLYLSLWAAFQLYHLLPAEAALGGMILVTVWNAYMAWAQDSELLAVYALAGAFATPLLLSTGGNHEVFLFTYLLAIDIATVALVRLKPWAARLLLGSFAATVIYFIGWFVQFFVASELGATASFVVLFSLVFVGVPLRRAGEAKRNGLNYVTTEILLPWWNAAFVSLALYSVLQDSGHHAWLPWLMLVLAAFYLALTRPPQTEVAAAMHLSIAVVFLTIAIPLKASGHWITVAWLVEGLALAWVATRVAQKSTSPSQVLRFLSAGAFVLGLCGVISHEFWFENTTAHPLLNSDFSAALVAIAALGSAAWLAFRARTAAPDIWLRFTTACLVAVELVALLLCLREIVTSRSTFYGHEAFANADFAMALVGIAVIAAVAWVTNRISAIDTVRRVFWRQIAGISIIAINLIAVLTGEREIVALWPNAAKAPEAQLQQALAVSAFLMIYGGLLLAVGFWKRSAFIRWQALLLIVFTIIKVFAYDTRNLSQGYRVVSFLGLGALLMVVSFAYQKDWLGLRESNATSTQSTGTSQ